MQMRAREYFKSFFNLQIADCVNFDSSVFKLEDWKLEKSTTLFLART